MADEQRKSGTCRDYDVLLRLRLVDAMSDDDIATLAESILEAVGTYAKSCVDGAAIGFTLEPPEINLDFTTQAANSAEVGTVIERVNEIIEGETSTKFELTKLSEVVSA